MRTANGTPSARLAERYRPRVLTDIVGQQPVRTLRGYVRNPYATCWLLRGEPGVGKSAFALALAAELGAVDAWSGLTIVPSNQIGVAEAEELMRSVRTLPMGGHWHVLIFEELERLSQPATVFLKVALASENLPSRLVVIATSNDTSKVDEALLERFGSPLVFDSGRPLADAAPERLADIWRTEAPDHPAPYMANWGWSEIGRKGRFSMRAALDSMQRALLDIAAVEPEPAVA